MKSGQNKIAYSPISDHLCLLICITFLCYNYNNKGVFNEGPQPWLWSFICLHSAPFGVRFFQEEYLQRQTQKEMHKVKITEHHIEQAICEYLNGQGFFVVKLKDQVRQKSMPSKFMIRGVSDLVAMRDGVTYWIEVKTESGRQSKHQKEFQRRVEETGGVYWLVRSVLDIKTFLSVDIPA